MTSTEDSDGQFAIRDGRHPLHEKVVDLFVPNDTNMGGSFGNKVLILTGPNASGKSVYLKQVGIISYLAHLGNYFIAWKFNNITTNQILREIDIWKKVAQIHRK